MVRIFHKGPVLQGFEYMSNDLIPQICLYLSPTEKGIDIINAYKYLNTDQNNLVP